MSSQWKIIIWTTAILIVLIVFRKPIKKAMTRGYRNNNPGNIRKTFKNGVQTFWKGEVQGTDKDFKTFKSMAYGYRELFAMLLEYEAAGYNTIQKIISRYAPSNENNTNAYINLVSIKTGLHPDQKINFDNADLFKKLVSAISYQENGIEADQKEVEAGFNLL
jgi:hypothetical protein